MSYWTVFHIKKKRFFGLFFVFIVLGVSFILLFFIFKKQKISSANPPSSRVQTIEEIKPPEPLLLPRALDGILVELKKESLRPIAVMVDNYIDARPTSGISRAQLVIEAPVEAGITRFLAFYATDEDIVVGPVRSARPYFVDWASEYHAVYTHVGGSPAGIEAIKKSRVVDADDIYGREYFWRDKIRYAPHNMYASTKSLREFENTIQEEFSLYPNWKYHPADYASVDNKVNNVEPFIRFRPKTNIVSWKYDLEKNEYVRFEGEEKYLEADGSEVRAKNIILMHMDMTILDEIGRRKFKTLGEGKANIFYDGAHFENIIWKKENQNARTQFFQNGSQEPFSLRVGTTWIEIVPTWGVDWGVENNIIP